VTEEEKFWGEVDIGGDNECWEWKRGISWDGYGQFYWKEYDGPRRSNRVAWELIYGPIPDGMLVCHTCDNTRCCNPSHLFIGTQKDNMYDASRKGRLVRSEEFRKNLSVAMLGNQNTLGFHPTMASRIKMGKAQRGKTLTEDHRRKISEARKNLSEEVHNNMREAQRRRRAREKELKLKNAA